RSLSTPPWGSRAAWSSASTSTRPSPPADPFRPRRCSTPSGSALACRTPADDRQGLGARLPGPERPIPPPPVASATLPAAHRPHLGGHPTFSRMRLDHPFYHPDDPFWMRLDR